MGTLTPISSSQLPLEMTRLENENDIHQNTYRQVNDELSLIENMYRGFKKGFNQNNTLISQKLPLTHVTLQNDGHFQTIEEIYIKKKSQINEICLIQEDLVALKKRLENIPIDESVLNHSIKLNDLKNRQSMIANKIENVYQKCLNFTSEKYVFKLTNSK